ncbi:unnamed protein product, partial [Adineta steineri]
MHIIFHVLVIVAIFTFSIHCQGGGGSRGSGGGGGGGGGRSGSSKDFIYLLYKIFDYENRFVREKQVVEKSDEEQVVAKSNEEQVVEKSNEKQIVEKSDEYYGTVLLSLAGILLAMHIVESIYMWVQPNNTSQPSNVIFVNEVDSTGNESNVDNLDSLFSSGQWMSRYFQYKQWHGPHLFSLFFNHKQQKVTGSGEDDVGEFSID